MPSIGKTVIFLLFCSAVLYARGSGDSCISGSDPYHSVIMDIPCTLELVKSPDQDIEIHGDRKITRDLDISCKKGTIRLQSRNRDWILRGRSDELRIVLYSPVMREISCSSSGKVISRDSWEGKELKISNRNSADMDLEELSYESIRIENKGSGDVLFRGLDGNKLLIRAEGSGDVSVLKLNSERADLSLTGSGDFELAQLNCEKDLRLESRGSGNVFLNRIETAQLYLRSSGSGDIWINGHTTNADITAGGSGDINGEDLKTDSLKVKESGSGSVLIP